MKILITGLPDHVQENGLREALKIFGDILDIRIIQEGKAPPWALVDFEITRGQAASIADKINGIHYQGKTLGAQVTLR